MSQALRVRTVKGGTYTLTTTPYADGSMGIVSTLTFTVINSRNAAPTVRWVKIPLGCGGAESPVYFYLNA